MIFKKDSLNSLNQSFLYGVIINNILGAVLSCLLSMWFKAGIAGVVGLLLGVLTSFMAYNASISFPRVSFSNVIRYVMLHIPNTIFQVFTILFLYLAFGCNKFMSYILAAVLGMPVAFLSVKMLLRKDGAYYGLDFHDDSRTLIEWINEHQVLTNAGIFILIAAFFSVSHWSILIGENLMKWDIWGGEYLVQILMTDALAGHTIPMWNPLMRYGTPWYSIVGTPIWYPFTMMLAYIGYTPITIAISYVMHIIIGGFGMFLLVSIDTKTDDKWTTSGLFTSFIGGLLYGGCGLFLSNAEHIMIIISAAWIPYVFYYMRRFITHKRLFYGGMAGLCAGLIFLGGYPEMFYNLFLFLLIYVLFLCYHQEKGIIISVLSSIFHFGIVCVFTIFSSAISLFPFLNNKDLITRGNGFGMEPGGFPFYTLLSTLFPAMNKIYPNVEVSMINFYMSILVILLIPMLLKCINRYKMIYFVLATGAFILCWNSAFFLHSLLYRFLPMYSAFRFPTTNRAFLVIFVILLVMPVLKNMVDTSIDKKMIQFSRIVFLCCIVSGILFGLIGNLLQDSAIWNQSKCIEFSKSAFISAIIIGGYLMVFTLSHNKKVSKSVLVMSLVVTVGVELLTFAFIETPITIAVYTPTEYSYNGAAQKYINDAKKQNSNRVRDVNFANHARSWNDSRTQSQDAAFNKKFEEEGYLSFRLSSVESFKSTYMRNIMEQNPEVYFTNDVVAMENTSYEEWVNACDTPPGQIFVDQEIQDVEYPILNLDAAVIQQEDLELIREGNLVSLEGNLYAADEKTGRVRIYLNAFQEDILPLELSFVENEENRRTYSGNFRVIRTPDENYVDIFFPDITKSYQSLQITCSVPDVITKAQIVVTERMTNDSYVDVSYFGFNDIVMTVNAPTEGYVTILQTKHDGWSAYVDGEKQDISLVDQCFMGLHLDVGEHTVVMKFRPKEFFVGAILTGSYLIVLLIAVIRMLLAQRRKIKVQL